MFGRYGVICGLCDKYTGVSCGITGKFVCPFSLCHVNKSCVVVRANGAHDFTFVDGHWIQNKLLGEYFAATAGV